MARTGHISLIVKGPAKSAKRAAQRHGVNLESCRDVGTGKFGDMQCYAPCAPSTNKQIVEWMHDRSHAKIGRGFPPGTLLYHGAFCSTDSTRPAFRSEDPTYRWEDQPGRRTNLGRKRRSKR